MWARRPAEEVDGLVQANSEPSLGPDRATGFDDLLASRRESRLREQQAKQSENLPPHIDTFDPPATYSNADSTEVLDENSRGKPSRESTGRSERWPRTGVSGSLLEGAQRLQARQSRRAMSAASGRPTFDPVASECRAPSLHRHGRAAASSWTMSRAEADSSSIRSSAASASMLTTAGSAAWTRWSAGEGRALVRQSAEQFAVECPEVCSLRFASAVPERMAASASAGSFRAMTRPSISIRRASKAIDVLGLPCRRTEHFSCERRRNRPLEGEAGPVPSASCSASSDAGDCGLIDPAKKRPCLRSGSPRKASIEPISNASSGACPGERDTRSHGRFPSRTSSMSPEECEGRGAGQRAETSSTPADVFDRRPIASSAARERPVRIPHRAADHATIEMRHAKVVVLAIADGEPRRADSSSFGSEIERAV